MLGAFSALWTRDKYKHVWQEEEQVLGDLHWWGYSPPKHFQTFWSKKWYG